MTGAMALQLPHRTLLRRAAATAALGAATLAPLAGPAAAPAAKRAKLPVVTSVTPMKAAVGDTLEIRGRNFRRGRGRNTVILQRDGAKAIFVKAGIATRKLIKVELPDRVEKLLVARDGAPGPTRFHIRILSGRFGKRFTRNGNSPVIWPKRVPGVAGGNGSAPPPPPAPARPDGDCDGDKVLNGVDPDDDNDLLADDAELKLGLDACNADSDGDSVTDGYELQSARDLNDDEYQEPNVNLPYPGKRPYPNPLDGTDPDKDFDGDALTLVEEYRLWKRYDKSGDLAELLYSDGNQFSLYVRENGTGRRMPTLKAAGYAKQADFVAWAAANGYRTVVLSDAAPWFEAANKHSYGLFDVNRDGVESATRPGPGYLLSETAYNDFPIGYDANGVPFSDGYLSDDERDEDADGLTNFDESHGRMLPSYWAGCYSSEKTYPIAYAGTDLTDPDSDGDGIRDGADDQDHDDIPNIMELSRNSASGLNDWDALKGQCVADKNLTNPDGPDPDDKPDPVEQFHHEDLYGRVNPFNPCLPYVWSRTCLQHPDLSGSAAPFDGSTDWLALQ